MALYLKPAAISSPADPAVTVLAIVRDPATRAPLAAGGEFKPETAWWRRRIEQGDVFEAVPPDSPSEQPGHQARALADQAGLAAADQLAEQLAGMVDQADEAGGAELVGVTVPADGVERKQQLGKPGDPPAPLADRVEPADQAPPLGRRRR